MALMFNSRITPPLTFQFCKMIHFAEVFANGRPLWLVPLVQIFLQIVLEKKISFRNYEKKFQQCFCNHFHFIIFFNRLPSPLQI